MALRDFVSPCPNVGKILRIFLTLCDGAGLEKLSSWR